MNAIKLVVRFVFVLFLAACGGGSTTDQTVPVTSSEQRMKALAATDTSNLDQTSTGFFYPIGKRDFSQGCGTWLGRDTQHGGCYFDGKYHNGIDMMHDGNVFAIADGRIYKRHCKDSAWGPGNCAVFIEHTTADGLVFTALYGHLTQESTRDSGRVAAGDLIGKTGPWPNKKHLHFGIFRGTQVPGTIDEVRGWGRMANSEWREPCEWNDTCTNSFEDPIRFIQTHYAYNPSTQEQVYCQGSGCWKPGNGSCENATKWYRIPNQPFVQQNQPFVQPVGSEICGEVAVVVQNIAHASNPQKRTPNEHGWQTWLRSALKFFGLAPTASAAELQPLQTYRTLNTVYVLEGRIVAGNASSLIHGTGRGYKLAPEEAPVVGQPDFVVSSVELFNSQGEEVYTYLNTATLRVHSITENEGDADWAGDRDDMYVRAYLSRGYKRDSSSEWRRIGTNQIQRGNINVGERKDEYFDVDLRTINDGLAIDSGIWNIVVCADRKKDEDNGIGEIDEKHESNNCSSEAVITVEQDPTYIAPKPNLVPYAFGFLQVPTYAGDFARFAASIRNQGNFRLSADIRSTYSVSCNGNPEVVLTDDGTAADELEPGESMTEATDSPVRLPDTSGTCTAYFRVDTGGTAAESDENDNVASFTFTLAPRPLPDFIITYVGIGDSNDTSIRKGSEKHPTMRIKNVGSGPATSGIYNYYYWCNASLQCSFIDGDNTEASELCVGCEAKERIDRSWSASKTGTFYLKVCTDVNEQQPELDETNNCRFSSPITVK